MISWNRLRSIVIGAVAVCSSVGIGTPASAQWRVTIDGSFNSLDLANAVILDAADNPIAAGSTINAGTLVDMTVMKLDRTDGSVIWRQDVDGGPGRNEAVAAAIDAAGDVIVSGTLTVTPPHGDFAVVKLDGSNGGVLWEYTLAGGGLSEHQVAEAVVVDSNGDVLAAGSVQKPPTASFDFTVVKLDGTTGAEIWRREIGGPGFSPDQAFAIAVDASDDAIAAGRVTGGLSNTHFTVVKLDGATGVDVWRTDLDGTDGETDAAFAVAVDASGDVIAAGRLDNLTTMEDFAVVKLAGGTGAEIWRREINGATPNSFFDRANSVRIDLSGDVIAVGDLHNDTTSRDFAVVKIAGASGAELWRQVLNGTADNHDLGTTAALTPTGDVVALGVTRNPSDDLTVTRIDGATGTEIWRLDIDGNESTEFPGGVAIDSAGDVFVSGALASDLAVIKLQGTDPSFCGDGVVAEGELCDDGNVGNGDGCENNCTPTLFVARSGKRLVVKDYAERMDRRKIVFLSKDPGIVVQPAGSAGDPTIHGAILRLLNPVTGESALFHLPGGFRWQKLGQPPGSKGYKYRDKEKRGACLVLVARPGRLLKAKCIGQLSGLDERIIPFTLDEDTQGSLTVLLQLGLEPMACMSFGGAVLRDQGTANPGPRGLFKAREAPAPGVCPLP